MSALAAIGAVTGLSAAMATANTATGGPDLIGLAAVITAISGLIGTLVMAYLAVRRRATDAATLPLTPQGIADAVRDGLREASDGDRPTP